MCVSDSHPQSAFLSHSYTCGLQQTTRRGLLLLERNQQPLLHTQRTKRARRCGNSAGSTPRPATNSATYRYRPGPAQRVTESSDHTYPYPSARHRHCLYKQHSIELTLMSPPLWALSLPVGTFLIFVPRITSLILQIQSGAPLKNSNPREHVGSKEVAAKDAHG